MSTAQKVLWSIAIAVLALALAGFLGALAGLPWSFFIGLVIGWAAGKFIIEAFWADEWGY